MEEYYTFTRQIGQTITAKVFRPDSTKLCVVEKTEDEFEASNIAEFICNGFNEKLVNKSKRILTENQKEFLLKYFFENEEFAGWKNIATKLLETGECIVAGNSCIWKGAIGLFIDTEIAEGLFGCVKYKFDLEFFLTSGHFKEIAENYGKQLIEKKDKLSSKIQELYLLTA